MNILFN